MKYLSIFDNYNHKINMRIISFITNTQLKFLNIGNALSRKFAQFIVFAVFACIMLNSCDQQKQDKLVHIGIVLFGDSRLPQVNGFKKGLSELD